MLDPESLPFLQEGRNLLAFSGGTDSTALFFLLNDAGIPFDIAHVNYHTRDQSSAEAAHAAALAERYGKQCHLLDAPPISANFEANARRIRYDFFEAVAIENGYKTVITAHQLDDRLEWMLMQLCQGAGLPELLGMSPVSKRKGYTLLRPLLSRSKAELKGWLEARGIPYFEDASNRDERYTRNRIRHRFAAPLLQQCRGGIEASFRFLEADAAALHSAPEGETVGSLFLLKNSHDRLGIMRTVDRWLKTEGVVMRRGEKERLLREDEVIISRRYAFSLGRGVTLVAPLAEAVMPKPFRERCRRLGIGPGVRPYLFTHPELFAEVERRVSRGALP